MATHRSKFGVIFFMITFSREARSIMLGTLINLNITIPRQNRKRLISVTCIQYFSDFLLLFLYHILLKKNSHDTLSFLSMQLLCESEKRKKKIKS